MPDLQVTQSFQTFLKFLFQIKNNSVIFAFFFLGVIYQI